MHRLCQAHKKKRNQIVNLMVTETSTHNQVTYLHRNSKRQLVPVKRVKQLMYRFKLQQPTSPHISSYTLNILDYFSKIFMLIFLLRFLFEILLQVYGRILKLKFKLELKLERVAELSTLVLIRPRLKLSAPFVFSFSFVFILCQKIISKINYSTKVFECN